MHTDKDKFSSIVTIIREYCKTDNLSLIGIGVLMYYILYFVSEYTYNVVDYLVFFAIPGAKSLLLLLTYDANNRIIKNNMKHMDQNKSLLTTYFILAVIKFLYYILHILGLVSPLINVCMLLFAILLQIPNKLFNNLNKEWILCRDTIYYTIYYAKKSINSELIEAYNTINIALSNYHLTKKEKDNFFGALTKLGMSKKNLKILKEYDKNEFENFLNNLARVFEDIVLDIGRGFFTGQLNTDKIITKIIR